MSDWGSDELTIFLFCAKILSRWTNMSTRLFFDILQKWRVMSGA
jgi:hypothetical protein